MTTTPVITQRILNRCRELGFALAGVCDARPIDYADELKRWLAEGKHGEMEYLNRNVDMRIDPGKLVPGAKSIICVADRHAGEIRERQNAGASKKDASAGLGKIARYARGDDYHTVMRKRLTKISRELSAEFPGETFRVCVDTAPVMEREHAQRAGLGAVGKNTLLIDRGVGSWLLLGEIITTMPLTSSPEAEPDPCGTCTRCIDACPTNAIGPRGWSVDAKRCISYLTIEHRSEIDEQFHTAMGDWLFGCDICQEVCPHNQPKERTNHAPVNDAYKPRRDGFDLLQVLGWDEAARQAAFVKSAMKRAKLDMIKRNARIVAGNQLAQHENAELRIALRNVAGNGGEDSAIVRAAQVPEPRIKSADTDRAV